MNALKRLLIVYRPQSGDRWDDGKILTDRAPEIFQMINK